MAEYFGTDAEALRRRNISYSNPPAEWKADELGFCKTYYDRIVNSFYDKEQIRLFFSDEKNN